MSGFSLNRGKWSAQRGKLKAALAERLAEIRAKVLRAAEAGAGKAAETLAVEAWPGPNEIGMGRAAIARDICKVFVTAGEVFEQLKNARGPRIAGAFYAAWKNGDPSTATRILRESGSGFSQLEIGPVDPAIHQAARGEDGRVTAIVPARIVRAEERKDYIEFVCRSLGESASGWAACAEELGHGSGIPGWKSPAVHGVQGSVRREETETAVRVVITNHSPRAWKVTSAGDVAKAVALAAETMRETLTNSES